MISAPSIWTLLFRAATVVLMFGGLGSQITADQNNVQIPKVPSPARGNNHPCGGQPANDLLKQATDFAARATGSVVSSAAINEWIFKDSGIIHSDNANCRAVVITVNGTDEVYFNFAYRGRQWHPWFCGGGYRTSIDSEWAAVDGITTLPLPKGKYLIFAIFKNWSHTDNLAAGIHAFPAGKGYRPYPPNCDPVSKNNARSAATRQ